MCTLAALRKCLAAQREKLRGCGWSQPTATSPCRSLSEHWTEVHPWGRQPTPGCIDLWEERESWISVFTSSLGQPLVQGMSCATVPSSQTLSLPIHLGTHPWLHSGACLSVTTSWQPKPKSIYLPHSSSKGMDPDVQPPWPDIQSFLRSASNLLYYPLYPQTSF